MKCRESYVVRAYCRMFKALVNGLHIAYVVGFMTKSMKNTKVSHMLATKEF